MFRPDDTGVLHRELQNCLKRAGGNSHDLLESAFQGTMLQAI
jgi:hypothetical protein